MKYVALLRGINVGGNTQVKMADLKESFEKEGFTNVVTYINSGNVIFETPEKNTGSICARLEKVVEDRFRYAVKIVVVSLSQFKDILKKIPTSWRKEEDLRCYVSFIISPTTVDEVYGQVDVKEGIDFLDKGPGVLYMGTTLSGLTKSSFNKLIGKKVYKEMTMRNLNTVRKILSLMEHY